MLYLGISRLQPVCEKLIISCRSKLCTFNTNVKLRVGLFRPNSNLASQATKTESVNLKASQNKDKLLFYYENPRYFFILNGFGFVQFFFWLHLAEFMFTKGDKLKMETNEYTPWWKKLNFEDKNTRKMMSTFCFLMGYAIMSVSWIYTLRSVRMLVLLKDNKTVSVATYGPFGHNRTLDVPLENITTNVSRKYAKSQLPIKIKGKWFYYILDVKDGKFQNPELFDRTAGMKRTFKW